MAASVPHNVRRISSTDLRNLVHYNSDRPRSTPIESENHDESTFTRYVRPASVVPRMSPNERPAIHVETTPLLTEKNEYVK